MADDFDYDVDETGVYFDDDGWMYVEDEYGLAVSHLPPLVSRAPAYGP